MRFAALSLALTLLAAPARAQLAWSAPPECATESTVQGELDRRLSAAQASPVPAQVVVTAQASGYTLRVTTQGTAGGPPQQRLLETATCDEAAEAAIVILALAAGVTQEQARAARPAPEGATPTPAPPAPLPPDSNRPADGELPEPGPQAQQSFEAGVGLGLEVAFGALPRVAPGLDGHVSLSMDALRLDVGGRFFPSQTGRADRGRGGELDLLAGRLALCVQGPEPGLRLAFCAGAELGRLAGKGDGVSDPQRRSTFWVAAEAGPELSVHLLWGIDAGAHVAASMPLTRPRFVLDDLGTVHQPSIFGARAGIFARKRF